MDYLSEVWNAMKEAIHRGIETDGTLPGPLKLQRKAASYYFKARSRKQFAQDESYFFAYALAVSEENASISGAEVGCQGEVGAASSMAAAAATQMPGGTIFQIEYAALSRTNL